MEYGNRACNGCDLKDGCDKNLRPITVSGGAAPEMSLCRHYTCDIGMLYAVRAILKYLESHETIEDNIPFGSPHKPMGTRWIRPDLSIISEQYGQAYPTGQLVKSPRKKGFALG